MANGKPQEELLLFVIDEENREDFVWNNPVRQLGNLVQQLIEIQDRRDLMIDLDQSGEQPSVLGAYDCSCRIGFHRLLASSIILMPELVPSLEAPACNISTASA